MSFHLTLTETAFAVPVGVIVGATVAYVAQRRSAKETTAVQRELLQAQLTISERTLETQREIAEVASRSESNRAREERLWGRKAEIYVELLDLIERTVLPIGMLEWATLTKSNDHSARLMAVDAFNPELKAIRKPLAAFASETVMTGSTIWSGALTVIGSPFASPVEGPERFEKVIGYGRDLEERVRDDLQV